MSLRSSGTCCAVRGCHNNQARLNLWLEQECYEHAPSTKRHCSCEQRYRFYRLPKDEEARTAWLQNLNLKKPPKTLYVCSFHFVDKKPTEEHPHPTQWLGEEKPPKKKKKKKRRALKSIDNSTTTADTHGGTDQDEEENSKSKPTRDAQTQWSDVRMEDHNYSKGPTITCRMSTLHPVACGILQNDADSLLYTGITLIEFQTLVSLLQPFAPTSLSTPVVDQILMTLMKLRQNFDMADLARRFKTLVTEVRMTVGVWIDIMCEHIKDLVVWLPRETIKATLPKAFKGPFSNTTCVIGCTEAVVQKTRNRDPRSESYSHYLANSTVKYLMAISPCGIIMFISSVYDDKCGDKYMVQTSGLLDYLRPGDEVMMDERGFELGDLLEKRWIKLILPAFTPLGPQRTNEDAAHRRRIAQASVHVERAERRLKVYKILSQTVPIKLVPKMDQILKICAGLVNLRG
ncbi:uncharacterized protein LOC121949214 [Plectropomus leopardus]|uniref:uncharacterized protein LOC121949214 n=1 Tax=Plectropomus leopardus TaxID=160734 RepID=UPI001C4C978B|nr:uncharacterized protein LOC121949214 [Plectropomus leopardus]